MSTFAFLAAYCRAILLRPLWALALGAAAVGQVAYQLGAPFAYRIILDSGVIGSDRRALVSGIVLLAVTLVIFAGAAVLHERAVSTIAAAWGRALRTRLFEEIVWSRSAADANRFADLIGEVSTVEVGAARGAPVVIVQAIVAAVCTVALFTVEWRLALVALATVPCVVYAPRLVPRGKAPIGPAEEAAMAEVARHARETAVTRVVVRVFDLSAHRVREFGGASDRLAQSVAASQLQLGIDARASYIASGLAQVAIVGIGAWLALGRAMTVGDLVAFIGLVFSAAEAMSYASHALPVAATGAAALSRVDLSSRPARASDRPQSPDGGTHIAGPRHAITVQDLSFAPTDGAPPRLQQVSLSMRAGHSLALVGPSGSGKSSLLTLLLRLDHPTSGRIFIDDVPLGEASEASVRQTLSAALQDSLLFDLTVRENIRVARPDASDAEVVEAARLAVLHDDITRMSEGYETRVGPGGDRLSGGQRQRVAIARAILRQAPVLLLDEPTSALDSATENRVMHNLRALAGRHTIIVAGHRLSALAWCDAIAVFERGRLVDVGPHADLLARSPLYRHLWEQQHDPSLATAAETR